MAWKNKKNGTDNHKKPGTESLCALCALCHGALCARALCELCALCVGFSGKKKGFGDYFVSKKHPYALWRTVRSARRLQG